jgi:hypothetical protein
MAPVNTQPLTLTGLDGSVEIQRFSWIVVEESTKREGGRGKRDGEGERGREGERERGREGERERGREGRRQRREARAAKPTAAGGRRRDERRRDERHKRKSPPGRIRAGSKTGGWSIS